MFRNSFKFLTLALVASLTVAPISATGWNSNSSRFGLAGLGFAVASLVSVMVYNYFYSKNEITRGEKEEFLRILANNPNENDFIEKIINRLDRDPRRKRLVDLVQQFLKIRNELIQIDSNKPLNKLVQNNKKTFNEMLQKEGPLQGKITTLFNLIEIQLNTYAKKEI